MSLGYLFKMCVVCVSAVTIASLITSGPTATVPKNINEYTITTKACPKSQVNKEINNKICLKNGKVYRWAIKKPSTVPTPTPTPTPKPTPTVTASPMPTPTETIQKVPEKPFQIVYNKINSFYNRKSNYKLTVIKSPKVNSQMVDLVISKYEEALNSYPIKANNKKITWVFVSETEKDWYVNKSKEIDKKDNTYWWDSGKCPMAQSSICAYGNSDANNPIFYMMIGSLATWSWQHQANAEHEAVHMYQMLTYKSDYPNCWIVEGQANAIGLARASIDTTRVSELRYQQIVQMSKFESKMLFLTEKEWVETFKNIEKNKSLCFSTGAGYSIGMLAVESLFFNFDAEKVDEFIINYSETLDFNKSLLSILKINQEEFYKIVSQYIHESLKW